MSLYSLLMLLVYIYSIIYYSIIKGGACKFISICTQNAGRAHSVLNGPTSAPLISRYLFSLTYKTNSQALWITTHKSYLKNIRISTSLAQIMQTSEKIVPRWYSQSCNVGRSPGACGSFPSIKSWKYAYINANIYKSTFSKMSNAKADIGLEMTHKQDRN